MLDFKNNELNNNGASSNKGTDFQNYLGVTYCYSRWGKKNLGHALMMNFVKNLHIHIFCQQESLAIRLKGKYKLALVNT